MKKRHSVTGWMVINSDGKMIADGDYGPSVHIQPTRQAALNYSTAGQHDAAWQRGLLKNGYRAVKVRVTVSRL